MQRILNVLRGGFGVNVNKQSSPPISPSNHIQNTGAVAAVSHGQLTIVTVVSGGSGYSSPPMVTMAGAIGATGPTGPTCSMGANGPTGVSLSNSIITGATGATGPIGTSWITGTSTFTRSNLFSIYDHTNNEELMKIDNDGVVTLNGSPNKAAKMFVRSLSGSIDIEVIKPAAMARIYKRAIERCLRQIKTIDKEEFIALLEKEIDNRTSNEMLMYLKEEPEEIKED